MEQLTLHLNCKNTETKEMYIENMNYKDDAGFDLKFPSTITLKAKSTTKIDLMVSAQMYTKGERTSYYLYPRSSIAKTPVRLANSIGIIDRGYTGNLLAVVDNISEKDYTIEKGQRLFQLCGPHLNSVFSDVKLVDTLETTERGNSGFGSTGV